MSSTIEAVRQAASLTIKDVQRGEALSKKAFLTNLQDTAKDISQPTEEQIGGRVAFALLNQDAPVEQRREALHEAVGLARTTLFTDHLPRVGVDGTTILERASQLSNRFAEGVVEAAALYPKFPKTKALRDEFFKVLSPNQKSLEDQAVSGCVLFDIFQPYFVDRLLELNVYEPDALREQIKAIRRDVSLMNHFYRSVAHAIEFQVEGKTSVPMKEVAERMFGVGPLFAKMIQGLQVSEKHITTEKRQFVAQIAGIMQEGIAEPDEQQKATIGEALPQGLTLKKVISSASIGHVVETTTPQGEPRATKVKRAGIEQAISNNVDTYKLLTTIMYRFVEQHAKGSALAEKFDQVQGTLPFFLQLMENDLRQQLNFQQEAAAQTKAGVIFESNAGIKIPKIDERYTDDNIITMEKLAGQRLEKLPAHPDHLKNIFILVLQSWKERFVHGDMHGGNIKGTGDGSLIAYDWGKSVNLSPSFVRNMAGYLYALAKKKPEDIAKAYVKMQHPDHTQATEDEVAEVAQDVLDTLQDNMVYRSRHDNPVRKRLGEVVNTIPQLTLAMGLRHQSTIDTDYLTVLETSQRLYNLIGTELNKPEYKDKKYRNRVIRNSVIQAIKEVYLLPAAVKAKDRKS